jgi:hypothetical protein
MTRQFLSGKRLAGTLLTGAAVAACLGIGAERVVAFGFRGGGGFHGGGGFGGFHGGGGFQRRSRPALPSRSDIPVWTLSLLERERGCPKTS